MNLFTELRYAPGLVRQRIQSLRPALAAMIASIGAIFLGGIAMLGFQLAIFQWIWIQVFGNYGFWAWAVGGSSSGSW